MNDSVDSKREETEAILEEIFKENPHLLSRGAKRNFRRIWLGYLILAAATIIGIWAFTSRADENLRRDINRIATISCLSSIENINKHNDFVEAQIKTQWQAHHLALRTHDLKRAKINENAIIRYNKDKIIPPTPAICDKPILP